jgi:hypothetical protein
MVRMAIAGIGAAAATVAGGLGYVALQRGKEAPAARDSARAEAVSAAPAAASAPAPAAVAAAAPAATLCVRGVAFVESQKDGCFSSADFEAMRDRAVVGADGAPITMELSSPSDAAAPPALVSTCVEYDMRSRAGWYPLSNAEMRREEYFRRACPALKLMAGARPAKAGHFAGEALSDADAAALCADPNFGFAANAKAEAEGPGQWRLSDGVREAHMREIAYADFDGDGFGDIMVFISMRTEAGAGRALTGLAMKSAADAAPTFAPLS